MRKLLVNVVAAAVGSACVPASHAQLVTVETVPVGNTGNIGELCGEGVFMYGNATGVGPTRVCGAVNYPFEMGRFEITAGQYAAFLNAVAATDRYGLYVSWMDEGVSNTYACKIVQSGEPGSFTYSVPADWADRPVIYVSWCDAARFANWMHNGQPVGAQDLSTTEDGSYLLNGAITNAALTSVVRRAGATWVLPSEDEWYKAAYHFNDGATGNYWDFPTRFNTDFFGALPDNDVIDPDPGNSANFWKPFNDSTLGPPYFRTEVGEFENSASPYGTLDQGGNVWEWTDSWLNAAGIPASQRVFRGGSYYNLLEDGFRMHAAWREADPALAALARRGFRLARVANDCNGNDVLDLSDIATGASSDHNYNYVPDECDIAAGLSLDCNGNGIPDEAEVGAVTPTAYRWDDGAHEQTLGYVGEVSLAWLSQFTVQAGRETIDAVGVTWGLVPDGTPVRVYLWSDPDGDGIPTDASVLTFSLSSVANSNTDVVNSVDIADTTIGPPGTSFFVGVLAHQDVNTYPTSIDLTSSQLKSWLFVDPDKALDPNALGNAPVQGTIESLGWPGNWMLRALPVPTIAPGGDENGNGVPDACELGCPWDLDSDTSVGITDLLALLAAWGTDPGGPPDFDGDRSVGITDLLALLGNWGACP